MIVVVCPGCHRRLQLADKPGGHEGQCAHCGRHVRLGNPRAEPAPDANDTASNLAPETGAQIPLQPRSTVPGYEFLAAAQAPDELGRLGTYRVLQLLGQGAMGMVFRAEDVALGRIVALKVMIPSVASMEENRKRFLREAQATAKINHPNVIPIYAVGEDRGVPYLAMPMLKGELMEARLSRERKLSIRDGVRIAREIAEGLAAAHQCSLVHRDIKPANLFLESVQRRSAPERVKILDFGLARMGDTGLTTPGAVLGTPAYMAPEQAKGLKVDHRCDLFSLGCVIYRMLVGERAFQGNEVFAVLMAITTVQPTPPREANPEIPAALSDLVMHLLAKEPDERPQSAAEVVDRLNRMGLISPASSTDKMPIQRPGSSGNLPVYQSSGISTVAPLKTGDLPAERPTAEKPPAGGRYSLIPAVGTAALLTLGLIAFLLRGWLAPPPAATVVIHVQPPGSEIVVDDDITRQDIDGSVTLTLKPGKHHLKVHHKDYHGRSVDLNVALGENPPLTIDLQKLSREEIAPPREKQPEQQLKKPESDSRTKPPPEPEPAKPKTPENSAGQPRQPDPAESRTASEKIGPSVPDPRAGNAGNAAVPADAKTPEKKETPAKPVVTNPSAESSPTEMLPPRPPGMSIDRRAALWVLECGGETLLKRQGRATADRVRNAADLPKVRFDLVMVGLEKSRKFNDADLSRLAGLRELTELDLSGTGVTDAGVAKLRHLPRLQILSLRNTAVTDAAVPALALLDSLRNLDLQNTKFSAAGIQRLKAALPACDISEP